MLELRPADRDAAVQQARALFRACWPEEEVRETHACLYLACSMQIVLDRLYGLPTMLQAGTCQWPMCTPEEDDGQRATHFSYQWNTNEAMFHIMRAQLPEMHVWLAYRSPTYPEGVLIDITAGSWPERVRRGGFKWTARRNPPDYLWHDSKALFALEDQFGLGINYQADLKACACADAFAAHGIYPVLFEAAKGFKRLPQAVVCSWCGKFEREGSLPASYSICPACTEKERSKPR